MSTALIEQPPALPATHLDGQVGDALGLAFESLGEPMTGPVLYLLLQVLKSKLKQDGFAAPQVGGLYRPGFCVLVVSVPVWRLALPPVKEFIQLYVGGFAKAQLAWWDGAEKVWRNLIGGPEPFERFLDQAHLDAAAAELKARGDEMRRCLSQAGKKGINEHLGKA